MTTRKSFLMAYGVLLRLYPPGFRKRFAPEMLELAAAAEPAEWPMFFADTGVAVVRCWLESSPSTVAIAEPNAYLAIGGSGMSASALLKGIALAFVVTAGLYYGIYMWPPPCPNVGHRVTPIVDANPAQAKLQNASAHSLHSARSASRR